MEVARLKVISLHPDTWGNTCGGRHAPDLNQDRLNYMTLRFLQNTASQSPSYPFQVGQVIQVPRMTSEIRAWIKEGRAELVPESPEAAVVADPERTATLGRAKGRDARVAV